MRIKIWMMVLTSAANALLVTTPHQGAAEEQVRAYALFELTELDADAAWDVVNRLQSLAPGNCKQEVREFLAVGEVMVLLNCGEPDERNHYLSEAVIKLAAVEGVRQATVLLVERGGSE